MVAHGTPSFAVTLPALEHTCTRHFKRSREISFESVGQERSLDKWSLEMTVDVQSTFMIDPRQDTFNPDRNNERVV